MADGGPGAPVFSWRGLLLDQAGRPAIPLPDLAVWSGQALLALHPDQEILAALALLAAGQAEPQGELLWQGRGLPDECDFQGRLRIARRLALVGPRSGLLPNATLLQSMCLDLEYNQGAFPGQAGRLAMGCLEALGLAALASLDPMGLSGPDSYAAQAALAISRGPTLFVLERPLDLLGPRLLGRILDAMREKADSGGAVLVLGRLAAGYPEGQFDRILSLEGIPSKSWRRNDETPILNG